MFNGRELLIATKHGKEQVIRPILEKELGVKCLVPKGFDTDKFGTFSGETERTESAIITARQKCLKALENYGGDLAVSSEGSFGNHPFIPFAVANEEIIMLKDLKHDLEIVAKTLTATTNFSIAKLRDNTEFESFLSKIGFPFHGVILKPTPMIKSWRKCIGDIEIAKRHFMRMIKKADEVLVETDMRAMRNPTRMKVIESTTIELVNNIKSKCPHCGAPGFSVTGFDEGLPCKLCYQPTHSILSHESVCQKCSYSLTTKFPFNREWEDPMYCDHCNP